MIRLFRYAAAEASRIVSGPLPPEAVAARLTVCRQCPERVESVDDAVGYCGACGCGSRRRARLTIKAEMPRATCPRKKWAHSPLHGDSE